MRSIETQKTPVGSEVSSVTCHRCRI